MKEKLPEGRTTNNVIPVPYGVILSIVEG